MDTLACQLNLSRILEKDDPTKPLTSCRTPPTLTITRLDLARWLMMAMGSGRLDVRELDLSRVMDMLIILGWLAKPEMTSVIRG